MEDEFEKAQKQWKKLFEKVEGAKRTYHAAARAERAAYIQHMNSKTENGTVADGSSEKCRERFEKCQEEVGKEKTELLISLKFFKELFF